MSGPAEYDMTIWRNADWPSDSYVPCDGDTEIPIDLATLGPIRFQVRLYDGAAGAALLIGDEGNAKIVPAEQGFRIVFSEVDIETLPVSGRAGVPAHFRYDLKIGGRVYLFGNLTVMPGVTQ
jgi:hypothetical protein